jgi:hypothetical protein
VEIEEDYCISALSGKLQKDPDARIVVFNCLIAENVWRRYSFGMAEKGRALFYRQCRSLRGALKIRLGQLKTVKYRHRLGIGASVAINRQYCRLFHTEMAKVIGGFQIPTLQRSAKVISPIHSLVYAISTLMRQGAAA